MSRRFALLLAFPLLAALMPAPPALASPYSMEIVVDGRTLPVLPHRGTSYVEALRGREYAIRLTNHTGQRVAVALAVDGLNSIDAKHSTMRDARKWILDPWQTVTIPGWQTGSDTSRRFVFTSEAKSYGAWLGKTSDLGVVSAAFFRERPRPVYVPPPMIQEGDAGGVLGGAEGGAGNRDDRNEPARERASCLPSAPEAQAKAKKDELAATGIGREVDHRVQQVEFDEEASPASVVTVRYEYRDALVRLGVLPDTYDALSRRERARGFSDGGFAPDPYRR
jgi:hypothetical protein